MRWAILAAAVLLGCGEGDSRPAASSGRLPVDQAGYITLRTLMTFNTDETGDHFYVHMPDYGIEKFTYNGNGVYVGERGQFAFTISFAGVLDDSNYEGTLDFGVQEGDFIRPSKGR